MYKVVHSLFISSLNSIVSGKAYKRHEVCSVRNLDVWELFLVQYSVQYSVECSVQHRVVGRYVGCPNNQLVVTSKAEKFIIALGLSK